MPKISLSLTATKAASTEGSCSAHPSHSDKAKPPNFQTISVAQSRNNITFPFLKEDAKPSSPLANVAHSLGTLGPFPLFEHSVFLIHFLNTFWLFRDAAPGQWDLHLGATTLQSQSWVCGSSPPDILCSLFIPKNWTLSFFLQSFLMPACKTSASPGLSPIPHPHQACSPNDTEVHPHPARHRFPRLFCTPATGKGGWRLVCQPTGCIMSSSSSPTESKALSWPICLLGSSLHGATSACSEESSERPAGR